MLTDYPQKSELKKRQNGGTRRLRADRSIGDPRYTMRYVFRPRNRLIFFPPEADPQLVTGRNLCLLWKYRGPRPHCEFDVAGETFVAR